MTLSTSSVCLLLVFSNIALIVNAFIAPGTTQTRCNKMSLASVPNRHEIDISRRSVFSKAVTCAGVLSTFFSSEVAQAELDDGMRGDVKVTPFNGLIYNYRGGDFGGLDASTLNEPSIPYKEFLERMEKGEVEFVEFMAPDGDAAYATFKPLDGKSAEKIRIGEGYPIEQHDGWSSPAFVVKSVKKNGVPYKFTVPGLAAYK